MRKHKWRRRLFLLVFSVLIGVIVLTPDRMREEPIANTAVSETADLIDQAKEKYQTYGEDFVEDANEAINDAVEGAVTSAARNFIDNIRQAAGDFFKNLILE